MQYYCDAAGELYDLFEGAGCKMMGFTSTDGYDHSSSKAERDGKFVGLMCDEDNQYDLSDDRAVSLVVMFCNNLHANTSLTLRYLHSSFTESVGCSTQGRGFLLKERHIRCAHLSLQGL